MATHYVVYVFERFRDGSEESAKVFNSLDNAVAWANRIKEGVNPHNREIHLFELGRQIPLREETIEVPQPSIKTLRLVLADSPAPSGESK